MEVWYEVFGKDVLRLMSVDTSRLAPDTGIVELNQETARLRCENLKQFPNEWVLDDKGRFQNELDAIAAGLPNVPELSRFVRFIF